MSELSPWPLLEREAVESFRVFSVTRDRRRSPLSGREVTFSVLHAPDWVNVVAIDRQQQLVLLRQYRAGTDSITLEIPGGAVDPGEAPLAAAQRELAEETGYTGGRWHELGCVTPNPAIQGNRTWTYLALDVEPGQANPQGAEELEMELVAASGIDELLTSGAIDHALVVAAFHWYALWRRGQP